MLLPQPLQQGRLLRRYKRFLADVELDSGETVTAHCANPGAMLGLCEPGMTVFLSRSDKPGRKLPWSWELAVADGGLVGINTAHPNRIVEEALKAGALAELAAYREVRREVRYGERSRVDFLLTGDGLPDAYVEVKNVHLLRRPGLAEFPDSVTQRGARHLGELANMVRAGHRAVLVYLVQRTDADRMAVAADIDPAYAAAFDAAREAGVEAVAYGCTISREEIVAGRPLPIES